MIRPCHSESVTADDAPRYVSRLDLQLETMRFEIPDMEDRITNVVTILIDGDDVLGAPRDSPGAYVRSSDDTRPDAMGWTPEQILGARSPLLATGRARRVAVYVCSCGESGCANRAPIIYERDGLVHWDDIRLVTGLFYGPERYESGVDPLEITEYNSRECDVDNVVFDAEHYRAEIVRASRELLGRS